MHDMSELLKTKKIDVQLQLKTEGLILMLYYGLFGFQTCDLSLSLSQIKPSVKKNFWQFYVVIKKDIWYGILSLYVCQQ